MSLRYIIDGNNVLHHPDLTSPRRGCDPRFALVDFILKYKLTGSRKNKVTLVFDGYPPATLKGEPPDNIEIMFSRKETADQTIRRLLEKAATAKSILVVSDDKEIKIFTRLIGARSLAVKDFLGRKNKTAFPQDSSLKPELSYSQIDKINQELRKIWLE